MGLSQVMGVFSASYLEGQGRVTCAQTMRSLTEAPRTPLLPLVPGPSLGWEAGGGGEHTAFTQDPGTGGASHRLSLAPGRSARSGRASRTLCQAQKPQMGVTRGGFENTSGGS